MGIIIAIILSFGLIGGFIVSNEMSSNRSPSTYVFEETSQVIAPTPTPTPKPTLKPTPKPSPFKFMTECKMDDGTTKEIPLTDCLEIEKNNYIKNHPTVKPYVSDYKQCQVGDKIHYYKTDEECSKANEDEKLYQQKLKDDAVKEQEAIIAQNKTLYDLCVASARDNYQNIINTLGNAADSSAGDAAGRSLSNSISQCDYTYQPRE